MDAANKDKNSDWDEIDWTDISGLKDFEDSQKEIAEKILKEGMKS